LEWRNYGKFNMWKTNKNRLLNRKLVAFFYKNKKARLCEIGLQWFEIGI
jgi:hypothetical protein